MACSRGRESPDAKHCGVNKAAKRRWKFTCSDAAARLLAGTKAAYRRLSSPGQESFAKFWEGNHSNRLANCPRLEQRQPEMVERIFHQTVRGPRSRRYSLNLSGIVTVVAAGQVE